MVNCVDVCVVARVLGVVVGHLRCMLLYGLLWSKLYIVLPLDILLWDK